MTGKVYPVVSGALWLAAVALSSTGPAEWETGPLALFGLCWVGATVVLFGVWRFVVTTLVTSVRGLSHVGRLGRRAIRWAAPREDEVTS
jgi:hypothetical protein